MTASDSEICESFDHIRVELGLGDLTPRFAVVAEVIRLKRLDATGLQATLEECFDEIGTALGCDGPVTWEAAIAEVVRLREFETASRIRGQTCEVHVDRRLIAERDAARLAVKVLLNAIRSLSLGDLVEPVRAEADDD